MAPKSFGLVATIVAIVFVVLSVGKSQELDKYSRIIETIHFKYKTSCVLLTHSASSEDLEQTTFTHTLSRTIFRKRILVFITNFNMIVKTTEVYHKRVVRPLYVVILRNSQLLEEFVRISAQMKDMISYPVWLLFFVETKGQKPLENICRAPTANIFNLRFNTELIVQCYDTPNLYEWYAIGDNITRVSELAIWSPENKSLVKLYRKGLFYRRSNMFNQTLRVSNLAGSKFVSVDKADNLRDLITSVFLELSKTINFSIEMLPSVLTHGMWHPKSKSWSGIMNQVVNNEADVGIGEFTMTTRRMKDVDFSVPLINSRCGIFIKQSHGGAIPWAGYFQVFSLGTWIAISVTVMTVPLLVTYMAVCINRSFQHPPINAFSILLESHTQIWEFPTDNPLKIAYYTTFLSAIIVYYIYSASLISYLSISIQTAPFSSIEGFLRDQSYKLILTRDGANYEMFLESTGPIISEMRKLMKNKDEMPLTIDDAFDQVCKERVAFYTTESARREAHNITCDLEYIESGRIDSMGIILTKNSPYRGVINYHLQRFEDNGMLNRIRAMYERKNGNFDAGHHPVQWSGILPLLIILIVGIIAALIIMILEILCFFLLKWNGKVLHRKRESERTKKRLIKFVKLYRVPQRKDQ